MSATAFQRMRREQASKNQEPEQNNLNDMSVEQLIEYAKVNCIDIGNSSSLKGILKKIQEAEKFADEKELEQVQEPKQEPEQ